MKYQGIVTAALLMRIEKYLNAIFIETDKLMLPVSFQIAFIEAIIVLIRGSKLFDCVKVL